MLCTNESKSLQDVKLVKIKRKKKDNFLMYKKSRLRPAATAVKIKKKNKKNRINLSSTSLSPAAFFFFSCTAAAAAFLRNIIQIESVGEAKGIKLFIKLNHKRSQNGGGGGLHHKNKSCPLLLSHHTSCAVLLGFYNNQIWACNLYTSQQRFRAMYKWTIYGRRWPSPIAGRHHSRYIWIFDGIIQSGFA